MVIYDLYYRVSEDSIELRKNEIPFLSVRVPQPLCNGKANSYEWELDISSTTVIVKFTGSVAQWVHSIKDIKDQKSVKLCTAPDLLPNQMTRGEFVFGIIVAGVFICGTSLFIGYGTAVNAFNKNPTLEVFAPGIRRYLEQQQRAPKRFEKLTVGISMQNGDTLCTGDQCLLLDQCKLVHNGKALPYWSRHMISDCKLSMQEDGNLVLYDNSDEPYVASNTLKSLCHLVTFSEDTLTLHCKHSSYHWHF